MAKIRYSLTAYTLICSFFLAACTTAPAKISSRGCDTPCVTPYGETLGVAAGNVPAFSNCKAQCVVFDPYYQAGTYTGIKWQCVEFARRWLLINKGVVYGDVDVASDIWNKIEFVTDVRAGKRLPLTAHVNGSAQSPAPGDLLVYTKEFLSTGHVAVITEVDLAGGQIEVAEQNFLNQKWPADYARRIPVLEKEGKYWVLDPYLIGWKHIGEEHG